MIKKVIVVVKTNFAYKLPTGEPIMVDAEGDITPDDHDPSKVWVENVIMIVDDEYIDTVKELGDEIENKAAEKLLEAYANQKQVMH